MKKLCILLVILTIPFIMLAVVKHLPSPAHFGNSPQVFGDLRSWRVAETVEESWDATVTWQNDGKNVYYYSAANPILPDSVLSYTYENDMWNISSSTIYTHDATHEFITEAMVYMVIPNFMTIPFMRQSLTYNGDNHLTNVTMSFRDFQTGLWSDVTRMHLLYNGQIITQAVSWYPADDMTPVYYEKRTFTFDGAGRIIVEHGQTSPDSTNWVNNEQVTRAYHSSDTTTGASFLDMLSHQYALAIMTGMEPFFGMMTEVVSQNWINNGWENSEKEIYTYDTNDHLNNIVNQSWITSAWTNYQRMSFTYDNNGNSIQELTKTWDGAAWQNESRITKMWEIASANDDTTIPAILNLSLTAYPNPFKSSLNIRVNSKSNAPVSVQIFNLKGQLVYQENTLPNQSISMDGNKLGSGVYLMKATQGNDTCSRKIIQIN